LGRTQILLKSDGYPTYHLANVVDDQAMRITHVLRGEEWLSSTVKHVQLYRALGHTPPAFAHLPLLINMDRTKLSKRHGALFVSQLRESGILPTAVANFVMLLGWDHHQQHQHQHGPTSDAALEESPHREEFPDLDAMAQAFDLAHVHKAPAVVNLEKLHYLNKRHIRLAQPGTAGFDDLLLLVQARLAAQPDPELADLHHDRARLAQLVLVLKDSFDTADGVVEGLRGVMLRPPRGLLHGNPAGCAFVAAMAQALASSPQSLTPAVAEAVVQQALQQQG
jgi:glutamyl-tRNA synthetase